ncbi:MAG TPA: ornithine cyclodeaminase family protein [Candidatus Lambdaproteobacteria bacterium]|jgi:ornithine cyclodeaminase|nr:ornithine cyclodeaminase family protein [Candidatus Lambdaproteobacteria bacterium]
MQLRILSRSDVEQALPMAEAIAGMKRAFGLLSTGQTEAPLRSRVQVPEQEGVLLTMPASVPGEGSLAVKLVSVFGKNRERSIPLIHAVVLVLHPETGVPQALLDGEALTATRTGAGAGAAAALLARPDAESVAILGSGVQARAQLEAMCAVRAIRKVRVFSPNPEHVRAFVEEMRGRSPIPEEVSAVDSSTEAVRDADIVCTSTTSTTPVINFNDLKPGCHVSGVGSFRPDMQEIDNETIRNGLVVVDARESALAETGDLVIPIAQGVIQPDHIHAEIGEIVNQTKAGRTTAEQLTVFKSCGVAVQDAVAARIVLDCAERDGLGTLVEL